MGSNLLAWELLAPLLTPHFRVVAYDQRGHGESGDAQGDYSPRVLVDDLEAVMRELGLERPVVVGHSWGAAVALGYAARHAVCRAAIGVDGGVIDLQDLGLSWELTEQVLNVPKLEGPTDELMDRIRGEQSHLDWLALGPVMRRSFVEGPDGVSRRRTSEDDHMAVIRTMWEQRVLEAYADISCPVLLVLAEGMVRDERAAAFVAAKQEGARRLTERYPEVRVRWLESAHDIQLLHPRELAGMIIEFLASLESPA